MEAWSDKHARVVRFSASLLVVSVAGAFAFGDYDYRGDPNLRILKRFVKAHVAFQGAYDVPNTYLDVELPPLQRPKVVNERSTLRERVGELLISRMDEPGFVGTGGMEAAPAMVRKKHLFGRYSSYDPERTRAWVLDVLEEARVQRKRTLLYDEGEGGYVMRIGTLPSAWDLGQYLFDGEIGETIASFVEPESDQAVRRTHVQRLLSVYARELASQGIDVVLGPVLDVPSDDENNLIHKDERAFSFKHDQVLELAQMYLRAMKTHGLKCIAKHFLNAGSLEVRQDPHYKYQQYVASDEANVRSLALYRSLKAGLDGVMFSHAGNPEDEGRPYSISAQAVAALKAIGFEGLIITDAIGMRGLTDYVDDMTLTGRQRALIRGTNTVEARATLLAFDAGVDVVLLSTSTGYLDDILDSLCRAYGADEAFRQKLETAMERYEAFASS